MKRTFFKNIVLINILIMLTASYNIAFAQEQQFKNFIGRWSSKDLVEASITKLSLKTPDHPFRFILVIEENDGKLTSVLDSPDRYMKIIADETKISGDSITITLNQIKSVYRGALNSNKDQMTGNLNLSGKVLTVGFKKEDSIEEERQITSQWTGESLNEMDSLHFVLKTYKTISGAFKASLDLPGKNIKNISVTNFIVKNDSLNFEAELINGKFGGKIIRESNSIKGIWNQDKKEFPVEFKKE
jgi:hypothetical protein